MVDRLAFPEQPAATLTHAIADTTTPPAAQRSWGLSSAPTELELVEVWNRASALADSLDMLPLAVFVLDGDCRVVHANERACRLVRAADGLAVREGRLVAASSAATDRLRRLMAAAGRGHLRARPAAVARMALARPAPLPPLSLQFIARPRVSTDGKAVATILLLVRDPAALEPIAGSHLAELYGLTAAEARLAAELPSADRPREIAQRLGIGLATVRTHLHRLYDKTGTRRQSELVRLLATLALL